MNLFVSTFFIENCDYSFGTYTTKDYVGLKVANNQNTEFLNKCQEFKTNKKIVTLFIDNLRLYKRTKNPDSVFTNMEESPNANWETNRLTKNNLIELFKGEDLLNLCSEIDYLDFIIFTGLDDVNLDNEIFERIPNNVLRIYASAAADSFGGKVKPIPFGLPRKVNDQDNRLDILLDCIKYDVRPTKLLYLNHSLGSNIQRQEANNYFERFDWCKIDHPVSINSSDYKDFLDGIKNSKFVLSLDGNSKNCDCYRVWETLYMKRVPVLIKSKNFEELFKNLPVLLVEDLYSVNEKFLEENIHIYENASNFDINKLDIEKMYNNILKEFEYLKIVDWIKNYALQENMNLIIGISGGVDSAVTSTLCALTNLKTYVVSLPINQNKKQLDLANKHITWLTENFKNVENIEIDLTSTYEAFVKNVNQNNNFNSPLSFANSKSRLRMVTLYHLGGNLNSLVVGTGNKIEDFGIGFFTKYGDGGVDISPIADLTKTEVIQIGKTLGIHQEILSAKPTDGLWEDDRCDEDQIGTTYQKLEWAMSFDGDENNLSTEEKKVLDIFKNLNKKNKHKMIPIPVYLKN